MIIGAVLLYTYYPGPSWPEGGHADELRVYKHRRILQVYRQGKCTLSMPVSLGFDPVGHKQQEGDGRTPEGTYIIADKNPHSGYYKNLGISYPTADDRRDAARRHVSPGGAVKIHGMRNDAGWVGRWHRFRDWTHGCIAVTNDEMEILYQHVPVGTVIKIYP